MKLSLLKQIKSLGKKKEEEILATAALKITSFFFFSEKQQKGRDLCKRPWRVTVLLK